MQACTVWRNLYATTSPRYFQESVSYSLDFGACEIPWKVSVESLPISQVVFSKVSLVANPKELISNWCTTIKRWLWSYVSRAHHWELKNCCACGAWWIMSRQPTCSNRWSFSSTSFFNQHRLQLRLKTKLKQLQQQDNERPRQFDSLWDPLRPAWIEIMQIIHPGFSICKSNLLLAQYHRDSWVQASVPHPCSALSISGFNASPTEWNQSLSGWQSWKLIIFEDMTSATKSYRFKVPNKPKCHNVLRKPDSVLKKVRWTSWQLCILSNTAHVRMMHDASKSK